MNKNHLKKNEVVIVEKAKEVMEDLITKKMRFFAGYCLGVPQESKEKLSLPLCNKETGELCLWLKSAS